MPTNDASPCFTLATSKGYPWGHKQWSDCVEFNLWPAYLASYILLHYVYPNQHLRLNQTGACCISKKGVSLSIPWPLEHFQYLSYRISFSAYLELVYLYASFHVKMLLYKLAYLELPIVFFYFSYQFHSSVPTCQPKLHHAMHNHQLYKIVG